MRSNITKQVVTTAPASTQRGFSLVEMAVVLVIMGLLLAMVMTPLRAQRASKAQHQTETALLEAKQGLLGHALIHHYLPCPDTDTTPDGWENVKADGSCQKPEGTLPWQNLGVMPTDAWGRLWRYRVDASFSHHQSLFGFAQAEGASEIEVQTEAGSASSQRSRPIAIVLSHGENGLGGMQVVDGVGIQALDKPISQDELENANGDVKFVDKGAQMGASDNVFDDMLIMLSPKVLIATMVQAQRLP